IAASPVPMEQALPKASEADRINLAKHRAQADLLKELNEALRRSAQTATPAQGRAEAGKRTDPAYPSAPIPPPKAPETPMPQWPAPQPQLKPLILGPQTAATPEEGDLWNLMKPAAPGARPPGAVASFEEALKRVDASLEALVEAPKPGQEPLVEATIEA